MKANIMFILAGLIVPNRNADSNLNNTFQEVKAKFKT